MKEKLFFNAQDIMNEFEVSKSTAYRIIDELNDELTKKGYMTLRGKISSQYLLNKFMIGETIMNNNSKHLW